MLTPSGGITVAVAGTVVSGLDIHGCVDIRASNVTIANSRISGGGCGFAQVEVESGLTGVLIEDSEIDGQNTAGGGSDGAGIGFNGFTALRLNIHNNVDGVIVGKGAATTIQDSWIHDLLRVAGSHNQDILSNGDTGGITIRHNRLDNPLTEVGTVDLFGDFGPVQNVVVTDNLLNGGGFTLYGGCDPLKAYGNQCQNIAITDNRFMRSSESGAFFPDGGYWGQVTSLNGQDVGSGGDDPAYRSAHDLTWAGNVWDDTGAAIGL